jgi:hypothetical protein
MFAEEGDPFPRLTREAVSVITQLIVVLGKQMARGRGVQEEFRGIHKAT